MKPFPILYAKGLENHVPGKQVLVDKYHPLTPEASVTWGLKGTRK